MRTALKMLPVVMGMALSVSLFSLVPQASATTRYLSIDNGDNALTREQAREQKEQWDDTRALRRQKNQRAGKEFDKADRAYDAQDKCLQSENLNAYWEPQTRRCLDRQTGRPVKP